MNEIVMEKPRTSGRFVKGVSYSPSTQFRSGDIRAYRHPKGAPAVNRLPLGSVRVRTETHTRLLRAWVKVVEPNVWKKRAVIAWESVNGPLPKGMVVHHKDRNSLNDDPENLRALTKREHADEHREEMLSARTGN